MEQNNTSGKDYGLYIEGHYVEPRGSARLPVINPATGETWATISDASAQDVEEEVFGPVLSIIPFDTEEEAVAIVNDSDFGLAAGVWTTDLARASDGTPAGRRDHLDQYLPLSGPEHALRGLQSERDWTGKWTRRTEKFYPGQSVWVELQPAVGDPFSVKL